ncbi:MAG: hypothetical protein JO362_20945 [Streptomycetaceae bacterium]|nr:hypothetical protein [Streptomycetaceae bacterium]
MISGRLKTFIDHVGEAFGIAADAVSAYRDVLVEAQSGVRDTMNAASGLKAGDPQLASLKQRVAGHQDDVSAATRRMEAALRDASELVSQPIKMPSLWDRIRKKLELAMEIVGGTLALLSMIVDGPVGLGLAAAAFGASAVSFGMTAMDVAQHRAKWTQLLLAGMGMVGVWGRGLYSVEELGAKAYALVDGAGRAVAKTVDVLSSPTAFETFLVQSVAATGQRAASLWAAAGRGLVLLPSALWREMVSLPSLVAKTPGALRDVWESASVAVKRDFASVTRHYPYSFGTRLGLYGLVSSGRLVLAAFTPMRWDEMAMLGFRGAYRSLRARASFTGAARDFRTGWARAEQAASIGRTLSDLFREENESHRLYRALADLELEEPGAGLMKGGLWVPDLAAGRAGKGAPDQTEGAALSLQRFDEHGVQVGADEHTELVKALFPAEPEVIREKLAWDMSQGMLNTKAGLLVSIKDVVNPEGSQLLRQLAEKGQLPATSALVGKSPAIPEMALAHPNGVPATVSDPRESLNLLNASSSAPHIGLEPLEPLPPQRLARDNQLGASDIVVSFHPNDVLPWQAVQTALAPRLGASWQRIASSLQDMFEPQALKPRLSAMTRGDTWTAKVDRDGWIGRITLDARVRDFTHDQDISAFEFEVGSESQASLGLFDESRKRLIASLPLRMQSHGVQYGALFGGHWEWARSIDETDGGRVLTRTKTVEPASLFRGWADIGITIDVRKAGEVPALVRQELPVGVLVAVPRHDSHLSPATALGERPSGDSGTVAGSGPGEVRYLPPQRIQEGRLGSTDTVIDVHPLPLHSNPLTTEPLIARPVTARGGLSTLLDWIEADGRRAYGEDWPAVQAEMLAKVDLARIHQSLPSMTAGQPLIIPLNTVSGRIEITARVVSAQHLRSTPQTEFNVGTEVQRSLTGQRVRTNAFSIPLPGQLTVTDGSMAAIAGGSGQAGVDKLVSRAFMSKTVMANKTKTTGEKFAGEAELVFDMHRDVPTVPGLLAVTRHTGAPPALKSLASLTGIPVAHRATASLGFEVLVETAEAVPAAHSAATALLLTELRPPAYSYKNAEAVLPPSRVWSRGAGTGTGLRENDTVRDLYRMQSVRGAIDALGTESFGRPAWVEMRDQVMDGFRRERLMAGLASMTRGIPLSGPRLATGDGMRIEATAALRALRFRRVGTTELAPQDELTSQSAHRAFDWHSRGKQSGMGGVESLSKHTGAGGDALTVLPSTGSEHRYRSGWRQDTTGKSVRKAKFSSRIGIFDGDVELNFTLVSKDGKPLASHAVGDIPVEVSIPVGECPKLKLALTQDDPLEVTEETYHRVIWELQERGIRVIKPSGHIAGGPDQGVEGITAPARALTARRVSPSDIVLGLDPDERLMSELGGALRSVFGSDWPEVRTTLARHLDSAALKPRLSAMTSGQAEMIEVTGNGVSGKVTVKAELGELKYSETAAKMEFENGSETQVTVGGSHEVRTRRCVEFPMQATVPHVTAALALAARQDRTVSEVTYTGGRTVAKAKSVEEADFFAGDVHYTVEFSLHRLGVIPVSVRSLSVPVPVRVAFPRHATLPAPSMHFDVPDRIKEQLRLSGSDVVLDVYGISPGVSPHLHLLRGGTDRLVTPTPQDLTDIEKRIGTLYDTAGPSQGMTDMLNAVAGDGRHVFGAQWPEVRRRIMAEIDLTRLQQDLKSMMAGTPIVVPVDRGRVSVTASVLSMQHRGNVPVSEFNTGTEYSSSTAHTAFGDGVAGHGTSNSAGAVLQAYATTDPVGHLPLKGRLGGGISGQIGQDEIEVGVKSSKTAMTMKSKRPATVFDGVADLRFRFEYDPVLGKQRMRHARAAVGFQALIEQDEARPLAQRAEPFTDLGVNRPGRGPSPLTGTTAGSGDHPDKALVPPARVWGGEGDKGGAGLRDTDVIRALPDTAGIHGAVGAAGRRLFDRQTWGRIERLVQESVSNARLATFLPSMTRGKQILTPPALGGLLEQHASVTASAQIVQLRYLRTDGKAELNPVNETADQRTRTNPQWWTAGLQAQVGLEADLKGAAKGTAALVLGGQYRARSAATTTLSGRVLANAKMPTPTAVYEGYVKITITLRHGTQTEEVSGVVPLEVGIPAAETSVTPDGPHEAALLFGDRLRK